jgi:LacI family transcriptional regulator
VSADIYSCGKLAVEHLVTLGHKHIGMIAADAPDRGAMRRPRAYRDVLRAHGIPVRENYVMHVPPRLADGQNAAHALLLRNPEITALYCYNDLLAMGALRACADLGRRVPQDCALVGCDDIAYASACVPALTTVRTDKRLLGARAVQTLLGMIAAPGKPVENPVLNVELIVRETT